MMDMSPRHFGLLVSLVVFCVASYLLVTASPVLNHPASESLGLPWGTLITWFGLLSIPAIVYFGFPRLRETGSAGQRLLKWAWKLSLILAILWPFASYYLADNWSYSFRNQEEFRGSARASVYYWNLVKVTAILPLLVLFGMLLERFFGSSKRE
jgi:hypothetical protein